jgi:hypothetical protein
MRIRYPDHEEIIEAGDAYYMVPGHLPFIEGCLERIGEDNPEEEQLFRDLSEDETQREVVIESLKADCEIRVGRPPWGHWETDSRRSEATDFGERMKEVLKFVDPN